MAKITFLGTSASIPSRKRDNTSFLFTHNDQTILIDCPGALTHKLYRANFDPKKLRHIIITHKHVDHIYGIIDLIHCQMFFRNNLTIYSSPPCIQLIKKLIVLFGLDRPMFPKIHFVDVFKQTYFYRNRGVNIAALRNKHIAGSFALRICYDNAMLGYSSDTAISLQLFKSLDACRYLIHECLASSKFFQRHPSLYILHTDAKTLTRTFKASSIKTLIPVHFLLTDPREERRIKKELAPLGKRLCYVEDFKSLSL